MPTMFISTPRAHDSTMWQYLVQEVHSRAIRTSKYYVSRDSGPALGIQMSIHELRVGPCDWRLCGGCGVEQDHDDGQG
jgi:hypothetical protein